MFVIIAYLSFPSSKTVFALAWVQERIKEETHDVENVNERAW